MINSPGYRVVQCLVKEVQKHFCKSPEYVVYYDISSKFVFSKDRKDRPEIEARAVIARPESKIARTALARSPSLTNLRNRTGPMTSILARSPVKAPIASVAAAGAQP